MKINPTRLQQHFEAMSLIGKIGETGTCRPAHTALEKQGFDIAASWMREAGMKTHIDNFGNLIGRLEGKNPNLPCLMSWICANNNFSASAKASSFAICVLDFFRSLNRLL